jgi:site-specific DNA-methyltransferase (adenine-specific)
MSYLTSGKETERMKQLELDKIYCGDCKELLKNIPDNSIDLVVTDPPYGIGFMGKKFDVLNYKQKLFKEVPREWIDEYKNKKNL